jgi:hypothetical protein
MEISSLTSAWTCERCRRRVPYYVEQCRCGLIRTLGQVTQYDLIRPRVSDAPLDKIRRFINRAGPMLNPTSFTLIQLGVAVLLLLALRQNSYDFYTILRWVVCGVSAYSAHVEFSSKRTDWGWTFVVVAVTFNPISPVRLSRDTWEWINAGAALLFLISVIGGRTR